MSQTEEVDVPGVDETLSHPRGRDLDLVREVEQPLALLVPVTRLYLQQYISSVSAITVTLGKG